MISENENSADGARWTRPVKKFVAKKAGVNAILAEALRSTPVEKAYPSLYSVMHPTSNFSLTLVLWFCFGFALFVGAAFSIAKIAEFVMMPIPTSEKSNSIFFDYRTDPVRFNHNDK